MDAVSLKLAKNYTNEKLNSLPSNAPTKTVSFDGGVYSVGSDVVNGQVSVTIGGQTWTNLIDGAEVAPGDSRTFDSIDGHIYFDLYNGVIIAGDGTEKTVINAGDESANMAVFDLTQIYGQGNEPTAEQAQARLYYINGTKSTVGALRLVSTGKNLFDNSDINRKSLNIDFSTFGNHVRLHGIRAAGKSVIWVKRPKNLLLQPGTYSVYIKIVSGKIIPTDNFEGIMFGINSSTYLYRTVPVISVGDIGRRTFTTTEPLKVDTFDITPGYTGAVGTIFEDVLIECQLERHNSGTDFEPYKESTAYINGVGELRSVNDVKDEVNVTDRKLIKRIGEKTNVSSGAVINYADMADNGTYYAWNDDGETETGVKGDTLGIDATSLNYQLATPIVTKLPAQAPLQVFENGTVYVEPLGDPSETTLPTVEMTIPTGTSNKFGIATHDYGGAAADWVLTKNEANCGILIVTNAGGAANIIAPNDPGRFFFVKNDSGYDIVVKSAGAEAGTTIADGNSVIVFNTGD